MLRRLFEKHPEKFVYRLQRAEDEYGARVAAQAAPEPVEEVDESEERTIALLECLLVKAQEEQAREDAEFAKRPDAAAIGVTLQRRLEEALRREAALQQEVDKLRGRA
jgi:hypothetical protein